MPILYEYGDKKEISRPFRLPPAWPGLSKIETKLLQKSIFHYMALETILNERIKSAVSELVRAGAREVYLFGSAASNRIHAGSDVDMAVSGLPPERFFEAMAGAHGCLDRDLDLVDLDEHTPFTEYLKRKGMLRRVA
jgi:predicted nucleotidyltransferase